MADQFDDGFFLNIEEEVENTTKLENFYVLLDSNDYINGLAVDSMRIIFGNLDIVQQSTVLPRVCKRWRGIVEARIGHKEEVKAVHIINDNIIFTVSDKEVLKWDIKQRRAIDYFSRTLFKYRIKSDGSEIYYYGKRGVHILRSQRGIEYIEDLCNFNEVLFPKNGKPIGFSLGLIWHFDDDFNRSDPVYYRDSSEVFRSLGDIAVVVGLFRNHDYGYLWDGDYFVIFRTSDLKISTYFFVGHSTASLSHPRIELSENEDSLLLISEHEITFFTRQLDPKESNMLKHKTWKMVNYAKHPDSLFNLSHNYYISSTYTDQGQPVSRYPDRSVIGHVPISRIDNCTWISVDVLAVFKDSDVKFYQIKEDKIEVIKVFNFTARVQRISATQFATLHKEGFVHVWDTLTYNYLYTLSGKLIQDSSMYR
jgi:hypothetical protein